MVPADRYREPTTIVGKWARGLRNIAVRTHRTQLPRMAAALAYRTIFALIPMFVIGVAVIGTLADKGTVQSAVDRVFELTGIDRIVLDSAVEVPGLPEGAQIEPLPNQPAIDQPMTDRPEQARLDLWMDNLVSGVEGEQGRLKAIGAVGVAALLYASLGFLIEIERAFNSIYRARDGRSWARRFTNYTTLLVVGPVFLIITFWLGSELSSAAGRFAEWSQWNVDWLLELFVRSLGVVISTLLFVLLYRVIPNARVYLTSAAAGAFIAAVLWELAKFGLVQYLSAFSGGVERLYGAIGLIPIFLLWVYVTWLIVLFGLQCAFLLQHRRDILGDDPNRSWRVVEPAAAVTVAAVAASRFAKGQTITANQAARAAGIDEDLALGLLVGLEERGVLHPVADEEELAPDRFTLAGPPETISAASVLAAGFALTRTRGVRLLREAQAKAVEGRTLADLIPDAAGD